MNLFRFIPGYETHVYDAGKEPLLFAVIAFLITFVCVRLYTRLARSKGWGSGNVGGVHLHHVVPGVVLMVVAGLVGFSQYSSNGVVYGIAGIFFGVGSALVLDEFALIFHLKDVYWREEGRASVDALIIAASVSVLVLVSASPFGVDTSDGAPVVFAVILVNASFALITFLKKKWFLGAVAILVPLLGMVGGIRLAKPDSLWARIFYDPARVRPVRRPMRERKSLRSKRRFGPQGRAYRLERWFSNLVGGAPSIPSDTGEVAVSRMDELGAASSRPFRITLILVFMWVQVVVAGFVGFALIVERNDPSLLSEVSLSSQGLVAVGIGLLGFGLVTAVIAVGLDNGSKVARWATGVFSLAYLGGGVYISVSSDPGGRVAGIVMAAISACVVYILLRSRSARTYFAG